MNVARIPRNGSDNRGFPAGMDIITANLAVKSFSLAVNTPTDRRSRLSPVDGPMFLHGFK